MGGRDATAHSGYVSASLVVSNYHQSLYATRFATIDRRVEFNARDTSNAVVCHAVRSRCPVRADRGVGFDGGGFYTSWRAYSSIVRHAYSGRVAEEGTHQVVTRLPRVFEYTILESVVLQDRKTPNLIVPFVKKYNFTFVEYCNRLFFYQTLTWEYREIDWLV